MQLLSIYPYRGREVLRLLHYASYLDIKYLNVAASISISVVIYYFQLDRCFTIQVPLVAIESSAFFRQWRGGMLYIWCVMFHLCLLFPAALKAVHLSTVSLIMRTKEIEDNRLRQKGSKWAGPGLIGSPGVCGSTSFLSQSTHLDCERNIRLMRDSELPYGMSACKCDNLVTSPGSRLECTLNFCLSLSDCWDRF